MLALGTTLASAAQAWSGEAAATFAVALAPLLLVRAEEEDRASPAALAGLPLGLAVALQPTTAPLALVLAFAVIARWRAPGLMVLAWSLPGVAAASARSPPRPWRHSPRRPAFGALALLASPAKGLLLFVPVALVRSSAWSARCAASKHRLWDQAPPSRLLPLACLAAATAHVAYLAVVGGWNEGPFWGPRLVAPAWPLLLLFLPEGFAALGPSRAPGARVDRRPGARPAELRRPLGQARRRARRHARIVLGLPHGPIVFYARQRVARIAVPALEGRRLTSHERRSRRAARRLVRLVREDPARADRRRPDLRRPALRRRRPLRSGPARAGGRRRRARLAGSRGRAAAAAGDPVVGRGSGALGLAESGSGGATRWRDATVTGAFRLRLPYFYAESGGADAAPRAALGRPGRDRLGRTRAALRARQRPAPALTRAGAYGMLESPTSR